MLISNKKLPTIPKLFRVQLAHANTAHCEIKSGYKIINTPDISNKIKSHGGNTMYYYDK